MSASERLVMAIINCRQAGITSVGTTADDNRAHAGTINLLIVAGCLSEDDRPRAVAYAALGQALRDVEAEL